MSDYIKEKKESILKLIHKLPNNETTRQLNIHIAGLLMKIEANPVEVFLEEAQLDLEEKGIVFEQKGTDFANDFLSYCYNNNFFEDFLESLTEFCGKCRSDVVGLDKHDCEISREVAREIIDEYEERSA